MYLSIFSLLYFYFSPNWTPCSHHVCSRVCGLICLCVCSHPDVLVTRVWCDVVAAATVCLFTSHSHLEFISNAFASGGSLTLTSAHARTSTRTLFLSHSHCLVFSHSHHHGYKLNWQVAHHNRSFLSQLCVWWSPRLLSSEVKWSELAAVLSSSTMLLQIYICIFVYTCAHVSSHPLSLHLKMDGYYYSFCINDNWQLWLNLGDIHGDH